MHLRNSPFILILLCLILFGVNSIAQSTFPNKTFVVTHTLNNNTTLHIPSQPLFFQSNKTTITEYTIVKMADEQIELLANITLVKGKLFAFGQEQLFNSSDTVGLNNNELAWLKEIVNKPKTIKVIQFHAKPSPSTASNLFDIEQEDAGKYFLPFSGSIVKPGLSWSDSTISDSSKSYHQYVVLKIQDNKATVSVLSDLLINTSFSQASQIIRQQLKGIARSERTYDVKTEKMLTESVTTKLSGSSSNGMDQIPISVELKGTTIIDWK